MMEEFVPRAAEKVARCMIDREGLLRKTWSYDYGVVWRGMEMLYAQTGEERYRAYIRDALSPLVGADGSVAGYDASSQNLDFLCNGRQLVWLWRQTGEERYLRAAGRLRRQLDTQPRTSDGGFWHKAVYPWQMWLDGQHMAVPFYLEAARLEEAGALPGDAEADRTDAARQLLLAWEHTLNPETGLPCHGWDEKKEQIWADPETGRSAHAWGRALGWYMTALADSLALLPENHGLWKSVKDVFATLSGTLLGIREEGVWLQVPDAPGRAGNYPESSGSCLIVYALLKGVRLGFLPEAFGKEARESYRAVQKQFLGRMKNGEWFVARCCQGAGLGGASGRDGSYDYYMSENIVSHDLKATGAFLQAACEDQRAEEEKKGC